MSAFWLACSPVAAHAASVVVVPEPEGEVITIELDEPKPNKIFTLEDPYRLVVDVPRAEDAAEIVLSPSYKGELVKKIRTGLFNPTTTRIVFELTRKITVRQSRVRDEQLRIDIASADGRVNKAQEGGFRDLFSEVEPPRAEAPRPGKDQVDEVPAVKEKASTPSKPSEKKAEKSAAEQRKESAAEPAKKKLPAADVKRDKPLIVIDPGHGGEDPGASGNRKDVVEKDIVLDYAQALKAKLAASGRYQVKLTRENDQFIPLRERVAIARKAQADLFLSIHADSAPGAARGLSVYTVSEEASDELTQALATRENKADSVAGLNLSTEREDVADILISLAERDTKNRSSALADMLVVSLNGTVKLLPDPHRFAGFAVLRAPDVPSVLIEIGFLSHPQEEKLINSKSHRDKVVAGILRGVEQYFKKEKELWTR